jgi:uncharacterized protein YjiS (DUF1127 family)
MSVVNFFTSARKALSEWRRREQAYGELMALDDHELADIGIRRSEIPALVQGVHGSTRSTGKSKAGNANQRRAA